MGIVQSDILLREAVRAAIREMRDNPDLIDDMLEDLTQDSLTVDKYGDKTIQQCKDWFTKTKINVKLGVAMSQADLPCVALALGAGQEGETTLGDVDWDETSEVDPRAPTKRRQRRGVAAAENHTLGCFVHGEPEYCLFLYSIVLFGLLRVKDQYLDQRGFLVNTFSFGAFSYTKLSDVEEVYTRNIQVSGKVRHTWPAGQSAVAVATVETNLPTDAVVEPVGQTAKTIRSSAKTDLVALMDQDMLSGVR